MVHRSIIVALLAFLVPVAARAELDLNPQLTYYELEGIKFPQLAFMDGTKRVTYAPPRDWKYTGSSMKLSLQPPNTAQAEATITRIAVRQPPMSEEVMKALVAQALASAPAGSTDVTLISQEKNSLMIGGYETFAVTFSYTLYGENYARSYFFSNRATDQMRFQFVSRATEFKALQKAFYSSLFTWQHL